MSQLKRYNGTSWETVGGVVTGDTLPIGSEVDYDGASAPAGWEEISNDLVVDSIKSKNLVNPNNVIKLIGTNTQTLPTGIRVILNNNSQYMWATIRLNNDLLGKTLTLSSTITPSASNNGNVAVFFGNANFEPIGQSIGSIAQTGNTTFTIPSSFPSGTSHIIMLVYANLNGTGQINNYVDYTNLQLEESSTITEFRPYQSLNNQLNYSIGEQIIGTWIDGKPLYRKVVVKDNIGTSGNAGYANAYIDTLTKMQFVAVTSGAGTVDGNLNDGTNKVTAQAYKNSSSIDIWFNSTVSCTKLIITLEYTKTTD